MRKIQEVLRLKWECKLSQTQIAASCGISQSTVSDYLTRAKAAGVSWPLPADLEAAHLENRLFRNAENRTGEKRPGPAWEKVHTELKKKGVTLALLWMEYKAEHPDGYQYSQFCYHYREWHRTLDPCLRQEHRAGEKLFVDYCGQTVPVTNPTTGEVREAQIFVAVLGASNYTYTEATWTQSLPDWIGSHGRALNFLGGCPEILVPDNLRSGVSQACRYEPDLNPTYQSLAAHYGITVIPARVRKPRDKAKCEKSVQLVENWILARLRNRPFFSLAELNQALQEGLQELNQRPFQKLPGSRQSLFEALERPLLRPLPATPYEYAEWRKARVHIDYHVEIERHYYSVPYTHLRRKVDIRLTAQTVEIFYQGRRIAGHARSFKPGGFTTVREHMPKSHREYLEWPPERLTQWAERIGPNTAQVVSALLYRRLHPAQGYRSCLGILRLAKEYGEDRLERVCQRALSIQALSYKSIRSILHKGLDHLPLPQPPRHSEPRPHENLRGPRYFH